MTAIAAQPRGARYQSGSFLAAPPSNCPPRVAAEVAPATLGWMVDSVNDNGRSRSKTPRKQNVKRPIVGNKPQWPTG
jgi:hypothetical protein